MTFGTSSTAEPGCTDPVGACNAGYQAGINAFSDAARGRGQHRGALVARRRESTPSNLPQWSSDTTLNADFVQGALNALHETEGLADVGIYASPGVWNSILGTYSPSVPFWMADYLPSPSGPGSCGDYENWVVNHGENLPGPPQLVQYAQAAPRQLRRRLRLLARPGTVRYEWRAPFENADLNALHAEGFDHPLLAIDWRTQVERHSLGWVCAFADDRLVGFVNVASDGGVHAFVVDTVVERGERRHSGIGRRLLQVAERECRAAGCEWLHIDFEEELRDFYLGACGFTPTPAGLIALH